MSRSRRTSAPSARPSPSEDRAFDRWVDSQLHRLYDDVVSEGLPPRLRELIERSGSDRHEEDSAPDAEEGSPGSDGEGRGGERS